jgi:phage baseplate assembly protein gpV
VSLLEDFVGSVEESIDAINKKFPGVVTGKVISVNDPLTLGRVQVQLPFIDAEDSSPWARVAVPMAGKQFGHYFIPDVDEEVLVAFEHGDVRAPYILGSLWTATAPPPLQSPQAQIRTIRTPAGVQIVMAERPAAISIQTGAPTEPIPASPSATGPHQSLVMDSSGVGITTPKKVQIEVNTTKVTISPDSVEITLGSNSIKLSASGVEVQGTTISIKASGPLTLSGSLVQIN